MVFVVERISQKIVNRCDAWEIGAVTRMIQWAQGAGYGTITREINFNGDMVIWVE